MRNAFSRKDGTLYCEELPLSDIAGRFGTPTYVYSKAAFIGAVEQLQGALEEVDSLLCYSVKSNSNTAILKELAEHGAGADIVSGGELFRALRAGIPADKIVYSGVGKTADEIRYALQSNIQMFNVESVSELELIARVAGELGKIAPVALRINPDVDAKTHAHTTTGKKENKFGIPYEEALATYQKAAELENINPIGIDVHLGSPIYSLEPYESAMARLSDLLDALKREGIAIQTIDMGGGFGIVYENEKPFTPIQYASVVVPFIKKHQCRLIVEPGRFIMGNAAVLLTEVTYVKETPVKTFYICNAGMNDLIRPAFYESYHDIQKVESTKESTLSKVDLVGPICESSDVFAKQRMMPPAKPGDLLAIMSAGAYCFSMASTYNSRPLPCEVLVDGTNCRVIRKRQTYEDLIRDEITE